VANLHLQGQDAGGRKAENFHSTRPKPYRSFDTHARLCEILGLCPQGGIMITTPASDSSITRSFAQRERAACTAPRPSTIRHDLAVTRSSWCVNFNAHIIVYAVGKPAHGKRLIRHMHHLDCATKGGKLFLTATFARTVQAS
jgi:hypothetical protein